MIYRRSDSQFWYYDVRTPSGGRKRVSTKRTLKREALAVAQVALRKALDREQLGELEEITLSAALERYASSAAKRADAPNIRNRIEKLLGKLRTQPDRWHLDPDMLFHELSQRDINRLRDVRRAESNSEQTINHELKVLSAAHNLLAKEGVRVPTSISYPQVRVAGKLRWLTEAEELRLLSELRPDRVFVWKTGRNKGAAMTLGRLARQQRQDAYDLSVFLLDTGCRYSEVGTIGWASVDTIGWHWIDIYRSKTGNSDLLTMTDRLRRVLQRRYEGRTNSAYVFPTFRDTGEDGPRGKATIAIRKAIQRAGLNSPDLVKRYGRVTTHTLRDTYASRLVQAGLSLFKVQRLLGHSDPRMTMKYAKLSPENVSNEAADLLNALRK